MPSFLPTKHTSPKHTFYLKYMELPARFRLPTLPFLSSHRASCRPNLALPLLSNFLGTTTSTVYTTMSTGGKSDVYLWHSDEGGKVNKASGSYVARSQQPVSGHHYPARVPAQSSAPHRLSREKLTSSNSSITGRKKPSACTEGLLCVRNHVLSHLAFKTILGENKHPHSKISSLQLREEK